MDGAGSTDGEPSGFLHVLTRAPTNIKTTPHSKHIGIMRKFISIIGCKPSRWSDYSSAKGDGRREINLQMINQRPGLL